MIEELHEQFRLAMGNSGLEFAGSTVADGKLRRFKASGDRRRNSWYVLYAGPPAAGAFGCFKRGLKEKWCDRRRQLSSTERNEVRRRWQDAERERKRVEAERQAKAKKTAKWILSRSSHVKTHAYLTAKGLKVIGEVRGYRGSLVVRLQDANGEIHSLQFIHADGEKLFLRGGRVAGCFFALSDKPDRPLVICEGYATGASILEATGFAVVCAMNSGNLLAVAQALRAKAPQHEIIIAADNDQFTVGNPGLTTATEAAKAIRAKLAVPQFTDLSRKPTDFNDLAVLERLDEVRRQLASASPQSAEEPNVEDRIKESGITKVLADSICAEQFFAVDAGDNLHIFRHGVYISHGDRVVKRCVKELAVQLKQTKKWSTHAANEVVAYISADAPDLWEHPSLDVINVANGLLNVKTRKLIAHSPKHFSPVQLPVKYDPAATCPRIDQFMGEVFPEDTVELAYEIPAWLMTPDISKQKAILFQGTGGNGKSAYLALLVAFLGKINTWSETLQKLEHNQFAGAGLVGKLANICADLPSTHLQGTSFFLRVTTGDRVTLERKNVQPFDIELYCRFIFSANHPPRSIDSSAAFFDRWLVVPFNRKFRGSHKQIPRKALDRRLASESELSGLLNKSLVALARLRKHNHFTISESVRQAGEEFRNATDPFAVWLARHVVEYPDTFVVKGDLRRAYAMECHSSGRLELTDMAFTLALKRAMPDLKEAQRTVARKIERVWLGIGLKKAVALAANDSRRCCA